MPRFKVKLTQMVEEVAYEYITAKNLDEAKIKAANMLLEDGFDDPNWMDGDSIDDAVIELVTPE